MLPMLDRLYSIVRRDRTDPRSPLASVDDVNQSIRPYTSGSLAYASDPLPGLERELEIVHDMACGVAVVRMTAEEAESFRHAFDHLEVAEESFLGSADDLWNLESLGSGDSSVPQWKARFRVTNVAGQPIKDARVLGIVPGSRTAISARTGRSGIAVLNVPRNNTRFVVQPAHSYWDADVGEIEASQLLRENEVILQSLAFEGGFQWDVRASGVDRLAPASATPPRIALIDSGMAVHPNLPAPVHARIYVHGEHPASMERDPRGHGTALAGIIAAAGRDGGIRGYLPHAHLSIYRAVPNFGGASDIDVALAITDAVDDGAEIICLPVSVPRDRREPLPLREALAYAGEHGVLCCLAAGNDANGMGWPACYELPNCVVATAYGRLDQVPAGTTHSSQIRAYPQSAGVFFAAFSNRPDGESDPRRVFLLPGVACITTTPGGHRAVSGTSCAAAHLTGIAGILLERAPDLRAGEGPERAIGLYRRLRAITTSLGWGPEFEGRGRPAL